MSDEPIGIPLMHLPGDQWQAWFKYARTLRKLRLRKRMLERIGFDVSTAIPCDVCNAPLPVANAPAEGRVLCVDCAPYEKAE